MLAWAPDATRLAGLSLDGALYVWSASLVGAVRDGGGDAAARGAASAASALTTTNLESSWDSSAIAARVRGVPPAEQRARPLCVVDVQWWSPTALLLRFDDGVVSIAALDPTLRGTRADGFACGAGAGAGAERGGGRLGGSAVHALSCATAARRCVALVESSLTVEGAPTAATRRGALRFVSLARLTVNEKLERTLERGEYAAALAVALGAGRSPDVVHKRQWRDRCAAATVDARVLAETIAAVRDHAWVVREATRAGELSFMYRYISRESCSQFDSLPLTSLTRAVLPVSATMRLLLELGLERCAAAGEEVEAGADADADAAADDEGTGGAVYFAAARVTLQLYLRRLETVARCEARGNPTVYTVRGYTALRENPLRATARALARSAQLNLLRCLVEDWGASHALPLAAVAAPPAAARDATPDTARTGALELRLELLDLVSPLRAPAEYAWLLPSAGASTGAAAGRAAQALVEWYAARARRIEATTGNLEHAVALCSLARARVPHDRFAPIAALRADLSTLARLVHECDFDADGSLPFAAWEGAPRRERLRLLVRPESVVADLRARVLPIVRDEIKSADEAARAAAAAGGDGEARRGWSAAIRGFLLAVAGEPRGLDCIAEVAEASVPVERAATEGGGLLSDAMPSTVEQVRARILATGAIQRGAAAPLVSSSPWRRACVASAPRWLARVRALIFLAIYPHPFIFVAHRCASSARASRRARRASTRGLSKPRSASSPPRAPRCTPRRTAPRRSGRRCRRRLSRAPPRAATARGGRAPLRSASSPRCAATSRARGSSATAASCARCASLPSAVAAKRRALTRRTMLSSPLSYRCVSIYRYISSESCSQFDSLLLTYFRQRRTLRGAVVESGAPRAPSDGAPAAPSEGCGAALAASGSAASAASAPPPALAHEEGAVASSAPAAETGEAESSPPRGAAQKVRSSFLLFLLFASPFLVCSLIFFEGALGAVPARLARPGA
jgi:hypothetical protein